MRVAGQAGLGLAGLLLLASFGPVLAQTLPPITGEAETVYSDADRARDEAISRRFVQSLLRPSFNLDGQFTRWKTPVCPRIVGLTPSAKYVVEKRIRDVAQEAGAPVDRNDPCHPNIVIFVSPEPQTTLNEVLKADNLLLAAAPKKELTLKYPVQAWYFGMFRDNNGAMHLDVPWEILYPERDTPPPIPARLTRLSTGLKAEMGVATVIVDAAAISSLTLGSLGDYLALMTLAQTPATGRCQPAPSIANLFLKDCAAEFHSTQLSDVDMAMLTALYHAPEEPERLQTNRVLGGMTRYLEREHGK
jgi:hypothetical protein